MHHVLYHANCADGFAAATISRQALTEPAAFYPIQYGDVIQRPPGLAAGDTLTYLDYTPPLSTLLTVRDEFEGAVYVTVIDHHSGGAEVTHKYDVTSNVPIFESVYDKTASGAELAWKHYFDNSVPLAVTLISHRDRGIAWQEPTHADSADSLNLHAALMRVTPRNFDDWRRLILSTDEELAAVIAIGQRLRSVDATIIAAAAANCHWLQFPQGKIPAVNGLASELISDACNLLLETYPQAPFSASWFVKPGTGEFVYSLRSRKNGTPVHNVAADMSAGGGGHPCAAGFTQATALPLV